MNIGEGIGSMPELILNSIRSLNDIDLGEIDCYNIILKCEYDKCKRRLHKVCMDLILKGKLCTFSIKTISKDKSSINIYVKDSKDLKIIAEGLQDIRNSSFKYVGKLRPPYNAVENFFDLVVDVAINRAGFKYLRGKATYIYPNDPGIAVEKRTIIEVEEENNVEKYYWILFIDYKVINRSSLLDKILEELEIDNPYELKEDAELRKRAIETAQTYVGKSVLTLIKDKYVYGEIVGIEPTFASEKKINGKTIYDIWEKKYRNGLITTKPNIWEYPLFQVKVKPRDKVLTYPPSALRLFETTEIPDPKTRWDIIVSLIRRIEEEIKNVYASLTGGKIEFRYIKPARRPKTLGIKPNFYTGADNEKPFKDITVKLSYRFDDKKKETYISPLVAFSRRNYKPYAGELHLLAFLVYPSLINENDLKTFADKLQHIFKDLNLGEIRILKRMRYDYDPANISKSLSSLENILEFIVKDNKLTPKTHFPILIIPDNESFYKLSKEVLSSGGYHSQLITLDTFKEIIHALNEIRYLSGRLRKKNQESVRYLLANISGGIYVEFLIQRKKAIKELVGPLTWILSKPADGEGNSMYVGFDISRKNGVAGAAFIVFDPYGKLIDARIINLKSETISYEDYYNVLRYMVTKAKELGKNRIVILRDGIPRSGSELSDCINAFNRIIEELETNMSLDYVSVIKRSAVRIFEKRGKGIVLNPIQGTYAYLYKLKHHGFNAHEILVVASKPEESEEGTGTIRPVLLRVYEYDDKRYGIEELKKIAEEYLALTRLNFWNLRTGASKLALPIKMADTLSYMIASSIPVRT